MALSPLKGGLPSRGLGLHVGCGRLSIKCNVGKGPKVAARPRPPQSRYLRGQERELGREHPPSWFDVARLLVLSGPDFPTSRCTVGLCPVIFQMSGLSTPQGHVYWGINATQSVDRTRTTLLFCFVLFCFLLYAGFSLLWPLPLRSTGSGRAGSAAMAHGPSHSAACGIFPDRGMNPCPLHRQADSQPLCHQGSPSITS